MSTPDVLPRVAIVGRPNVGKSTLFNRLLGQRRSIVHDEPGVTRDRVMAEVQLGDRRVELIDTGGLVLGDEPLGIDEQVLRAVDAADLLVLVIDAREGLTSADEKVVETLRARNRRVVVAANKGDTKAAKEGYLELYSLGFEAVVLVSAEHGGGMAELIEEICLRLPDSDAVARPSAPALAIVGRPNVGKSSLLNRIVGEERALVSPIPGTTRDPLDTLVEIDGQQWLLVDTAGIRRRAKVSGDPEAIAVMLARRQIERAEVALLVIDASIGVTSGDLGIAGVIWELGRSAVVVINKWDLLDDEAREELELSMGRLDELLGNPPRVNVSALTGRGLNKLFAGVAEGLAGARFKVGTGELNRVLEAATKAHHAPSIGGRPWKFFYATQVGSGPPTFMLFANRLLQRQDNYRRYLENRLREAFQLPGTPIRLVVRRRGGPPPGT